MAGGVVLRRRALPVAGGEQMWRADSISEFVSNLMEIDMQFWARARLVVSGGA